MIRVGINGMGRIGRCVFRSWLESGRDDVEIVAVNDLADAALIAHLLSYDSSHGGLGQEIRVEDGFLWVGAHRIRITAQPQVRELNWSEQAVDIVFECTGRFRSAAELQAHLDAGAAKVLLGAPGADDVDRTVVFGINHRDLLASDRIVSNASCTTNCLAPIVRVLHENFGVQNGLMTTVHSYTNDQQLIDGPHKDPRRARSAGASMIPTTTGAAASLGLVMPEMAGKLTGYSMRVPTANVSVVDLTTYLEKPASAAQIESAMSAAAAGDLRDILTINQAPLVSVDFNGNPASSIFDATQTLVSGNLAKILSWYDNEWGYSNRMLDVAAYWGQTHVG